MTFETTERSVVDAWLEGTGADWAWKPDGALLISMVRPATLRRPVIGTEHWFNQADQFHIAGMGEDAAMMAAVVPEDILPQSVSFADGSPIRWTENFFSEDRYEYVAEMEWPAPGARARSAAPRRRTKEHS